MPERYPLTVHVPIKGKLLLRIDGTEALHEVGAFQQDVSVAFTPGPGEVSFQFEEKFWEGAVKDRGVEPPTPTSKPSASEAYDLSKEISVAVLKRYVDYMKVPVDQIAGDIADALRLRGLT
jgi:hypothetical protein